MNCAAFPVDAVASTGKAALPGHACDQPANVHTACLAYIFNYGFLAKMDVARLQHVRHAKGARVCRSELESFLFTVRSQLDNELAGQLGDDDLEGVRSAINSGFEWLDHNAHTDAAACKDKQNEVYDTVRPVLARAEAAANNHAQDDCMTSCELLTLAARRCVIVSATF